METNTLRSTEATEEVGRGFSELPTESATSTFSSATGVSIATSVLAATSNGVLGAAASLAAGSATADGPSDSAATTSRVLRLVPEQQLRIPLTRVQSPYGHYNIQLSWSSFTRRELHHPGYPTRSSFTTEGNNNTLEALPGLPSTQKGTTTAKTVSHLVVFEVCKHRRKSLDKRVFL
ncbi:hypothetical protein Taro_003716 [Colocasia esculenta]|uniref:Uncharacterized protein n=1 Tax=Colocasia esculenta TaxID=4460 RepID=A0A843TG88_COLES|nr:hypothetical protein [Colocasia esculenta]